MGAVKVDGLGKAYKQYPTRWSRLAEWLLPAAGPRHKLHWVLRDVSFEVNQGEAVGVIGANGAGKSTLLKLITGTAQSTTGTVRMVGRVAALLELGMGFHPDFTGRQNVYMAGQLLGLGGDEISTLMSDIEGFADIGYYIDEPVRIYSSGMMVRLAFSVATARRPDLLIVDEALSVGDAYFQHKSFNRIREFQAHGTTLLLVSHDLAAVRSICSRAVWLDKGIVRAYGDTRTVVDAYSASVYAQQQQFTQSAGEVEAPVAVEQVEAPAVADAPAAISAPHGAVPAEDLRDCRQDFIDGTTLRNDIRVFEFDRNANRWGTREVRITRASLENEAGEAVTWVMGGERVRVRVQAVADRPKSSLLVGFIVKDRTGQALFGDNTYLGYVDRPVAAGAGAKIDAAFAFRMPVMPRGTYAIAVAVASGTQDNHVIEEWIDEALFFESHNANTVQGLIGVPMQEIVLTAGSAA